MRTVVQLLLLTLTTATLFAQDPVPEIQEDWFEHDQLIERIFFNDQIAIYFDADVNREYTWMNDYLTDAWKYTKDVYGDFGVEETDESRMYGVFHTGRFGGGHPGTYLNPRHGFRNIIDVGAGPWDCRCGTPLDLVTHEIAHIVEFAALGVHGSPSFSLWGDSKWAEIYQYDVYDGLGMTVERDRWYAQMIASTDNIPVPGVNWFRDFWMPLYTDYGGTDLLRNYFTTLAENFPTVPREYNGNDGVAYANGLNWGEFIHFWSGAAGADITQVATDAFGWTNDYERQFQQAQRDYPLAYHADAPISQDTFNQITLYVECDFAGDSATIGLGNYLLPELISRGLANDALSSIKITEGYEVILFGDNNFEGASITLTADDSCLDDDAFDDDVSSIQVKIAGEEEEDDGDITNDGGQLTASTTDSPAAEGVENLTDDAATSKYLTFNPQASITYAATASYVLEEYTLTSANDFPGRDPGAWTLSGSNNGTDWTPIDMRTGETFTGRFEKRSFEIANEAPFSYYKIDLTAQDTSLSILQLAEWELFGTENSVSTRAPVPADQINLYPNPTESMLFVQVQNSVGTYDYVIRDIAGRVTGRGRTSGSIDVGTLPSGTYLLSLHIEHQEVTTRFVKK